MKRFLDELSECEENVTAQDSRHNLKSNSPEHQTAESESGMHFFRIFLQDDEFNIFRSFEELKFYINNTSKDKCTINISFLPSDLYF